MILQALKEYYDRKAAAPGSDIAPEGFERKELPFLIVIGPDGHFVNLEDTREQVGRRLVGKTYLLPRSKGRSGSKSYQTTFLLWDHAGYVLGWPAGDGRAGRQHETWLSGLRSLPAELQKDNGVAAMVAFYAKDGPSQVKEDPSWDVCASLPSCNLAFRLAGDDDPVPCREAVREYVRSSLASGGDPTVDGEGPPDEKVLGRCLVTGEYGEIARTHGRTPINKDTKSLVAFQKNYGFDSHGRQQGYNAPVSKSVEFAYTTALNTLLRSPRQRLQVGDAVTVFWAARDDRFETQVPDFFGDPPQDDPDRLVEAVRSLYRAVEGGFVTDSDCTPFYVLGLSPNAARIAVRFWHQGTVAEMATRFRRHFDDTAVTHGPNDRPYLSLRRLLVSTAPLGRTENIPPNLAGDTMRAILDGLPYPATLLQSAVRRNRAEQDVTYPRAALIKACINRDARFHHQEQEELHVSLDPANTNVGYRLGRLFAALERIQERASPGINATIRDRYYGAASGTPATVFGTLMRLKNHHLAKLDNAGERVNLERLLGEIMDGVSDFPPHLPLADQGRFAIGYYHQRQSFFTPKTEKNA